MKFELKSSAEGWVLTIESTNWVYPTIKRALTRIKSTVEEEIILADDNTLQERINRGISAAGVKS